LLALRAEVNGRGRQSGLCLRKYGDGNCPTGFRTRANRALAGTLSRGNELSDPGSSGHLNYAYRDALERVEMLPEWCEADPEAEQLEMPDIELETIAPRYWLSS